MRVSDPDEQTVPTVPDRFRCQEGFGKVMRDLAVEEAPRLFALVEEYGESEHARRGLRPRLR